MNRKQFLLDLKSDEVNRHSELLKKKSIQLAFKRFFDLIMSIILIILTSPVLIFIGLCIKLDDRGPIFFKQTRITRYGKKFNILKFRTMVRDAEKLGSQVTINNDPRITKIGEKIRRVRLDELPQLFNIVMGDMSFVGTRPEVSKYVDCYTSEMKTTLLLRAGVTSMASIEFKDESILLSNSKNPDSTYIEEVLPQKMKINIKEIEDFSLIRDLKILCLTIVKVIS